MHDGRSASCRPHVVRAAAPEIVRRQGRRDGGPARAVIMVALVRDGPDVVRGAGPQRAHRAGRTSTLYGLPCGAITMHEAGPVTSLRITREPHVRGRHRPYLIHVLDNTRQGSPARAVIMKDRSGAADRPYVV